MSVTVCLNKLFYTPIEVVVAMNVVVPFNSFGFLHLCVCGCEYVHVHAVLWGQDNLQKLVLSTL